MAGPQGIVGTKLLILIGNLATPQVFVAPCGLVTKSVDFSASTSDDTDIDCDDPDKAAWVARVVESLSSQVGGAGKLDKASFGTWREWFMSGEARDVHIKMDDADLGTFAGRYILTSFKLAADGKKRVTVDLTMASDGEVTWTDAA